MLSMHLGGLQLVILTTGPLCHLSDSLVFFKVIIMLMYIFKYKKIWEGSCCDDYDNIFLSLAISYCWYWDDNK